MTRLPNGTQSPLRGFVHYAWAYFYLMAVIQYGIIDVIKGVKTSIETLLLTSICVFLLALRSSITANTTEAHHNPPYGPSYRSRTSSTDYFREKTDNDF